MHRFPTSLDSNTVADLERIVLGGTIGTEKSAFLNDLCEIVEYGLYLKFGNPEMTGPHPTESAAQLVQSSCGATQEQLQRCADALGQVNDQHLAELAAPPSTATAASTGGDAAAAAPNVAGKIGAINPDNLKTLLAFALQIVQLLMQLRNPNNPPAPAGA